MHICVSTKEICGNISYCIVFSSSEYNPPAPPKDSGLHRYIFLLIQQPEEETEYLPIAERGKFKINKYAKEHKLGNLAGITFFQTKQSDQLKLPVTT